MWLSDRRESCCLLVQDNTDEGAVDLKSAVVMNEAQFPEFVHEKIHPRSRCANHLRQHLLGNFGKHLLRLGFLAVASEQQKSPSQPFLARIEKLVDQILFDSDVPRKHIRHEAVGESMFSVEHANHLGFFNNE